MERNGEKIPTLSKSFSTPNIIQDLVFEDDDPNIPLPKEMGLIYTSREGPELMVRGGTKEKLVEKLFVGGTGSGKKNKYKYSKSKFLLSKKKKKFI